MSHDDNELVDKWVVEIEDRIERNIENPNNSHGDREDQPSIFGKWQCWDDFEASFIPETLKWIFVASMTHYFGLDMRSYIVDMQKEVDRAWSYYRGVQFRTSENNKRFLEHLLVNSCFVIFSLILLSGEKEELMDRWREIINKDNRKGLSVSDIKKIRDFIMEDPMRTKGYMMTMNYQIPWFVVEAVYTKCSNLSELFKTPIHQIAYLFHRGFQPAPPKKIDEGRTLPVGDFKHLLHIFHLSRIPDGKYLQPSRPSKWIGRFYIPTATNLQLSQTVFIKDEGGSIDVTYSDSNKLSREMKLTPWHFLQYSIKLYENLLQFERWYGNKCGYPFSSYVTCMASLIKTEEDVRILRTSEIIPNTTFDDKAILSSVQNLRTLIDDNLPMPEKLVNLEKEVMAHHEKSVYRIIGEFKKRYCSNTWIIISVIAGILLFVLTFLQTVYGVLSYYI